MGDEKIERSIARQKFRRERSERLERGRKERGIRDDRSERDGRESRRRYRDNDPRNLQDRHTPPRHDISRTMKRMKRDWDKTEELERIQKEKDAEISRLKDENRKLNCDLSLLINSHDSLLNTYQQDTIALKNCITSLTWSKSALRTEFSATETYRTTVQRKSLLTPPAPKTQKRPRQPCWSKRKTPTPPPDEDSPLGHFLQEHANSPEVTVPIRKPKYPNTLLVRPGTTVRHGQPQTPFTGQSLVGPVIGQQVPTIAQSQRSIVNQSPVPVITQAQVPFVDHSHVPFADLPQVTSIKQKIILPDDETNSSFINSCRVEMTFCVQQDEDTAASESATSDTAMVVTENIAATPDAFAHTRTSLQSSSGQSSSSTAMGANVTSAIAPSDTLPVDLNLVKKEVDD